MTTSLPCQDSSFTPAEREILGGFFTNCDLPVFGLKGLPEVVKGALFARYSRSPKSIRRLFLDEFYHSNDDAISSLTQAGDAVPRVGTRRADELYDRVFNQYGDDSVAQLGGAHIACEGVSNVVTKIIERGRLAAYLEQSTRYIRYDQRVGGSYRYATPAEIAQSSLSSEYRAVMDLLFDTYSRMLADLLPWLEERFPRSATDSAAVWRATINAKACDIARGLLPASTTANLGIFATGQAFEMLLIRLFAHPLEEARAYAELMLNELRRMIPSFMRRVDEENRGRAWSKYLRDVRTSMTEIQKLHSAVMRHQEEVTLVDWEREHGEEKVIAATLYEAGHSADTELLDLVKNLSEAEKDAIFEAYVGDRKNRRHKPGRALERISYRFDILSDYAGFRDLQRHRMLTIEWQRLTTAHGYVVPPEIQELGHAGAWRRAMEEAHALHTRATAEIGEEAAQYVVPFAYRIRYMMQMNAREAFHLIELRSQRQGHPGYRRICQEMHRQIDDVAGHKRIARAMVFVDHQQYDLERLEAERGAEARLQRATQKTVML